MKVYVLLFHDVWEIGGDYPPEDVSVSGVFASQEAAEAAQVELTDRDYYTIEEHELGGLAAQEADEDEARFIALFDREWAKDGECELDEGTVRLSDLRPYVAPDGSGDHGLLTIPKVSVSDDGGAYVRAWVWVDDDQGDGDDA